MKTDLLSPILDAEHPDIHYFEGRLLTARDLREQQHACKARFENLGQVAGAGVIKGLEVSIGEKDADSTIPVLNVSSGLALNRLGVMLELTSGIELSLIRRFDDLPQEAGAFQSCILPDTEPTPFGTGVYVLIMSPASGYKEYAPKVGLESGGKTIDCGRRYQIEGVQFRLEKLEASNLSGVAATTRNLFNQLLTDTSAPNSCRFQNLLAHLCFGSEKRAGASLSIAQQPEVADYGALDDLIKLERLKDEDAPLALLHWSSQGIEFVDQWSVRRKPYVLPATADWADLIQPRYQAEAEAMLFQFQDTIERMLKKLGTVSTMQAFGQLDFLPPAGFLPVGDSRFDWKIFFGRHAPESTVPLHKGLLQSILSKAWLGTAVPVRNDSAAIPYTVYEIEGESDYVLFTRSLYGEVVARDVYFDASSCALPVGNSVQDALQQLCLNSKGTCSLTVSPATDFAALINNLSADQDIHICFQPGTYPLQSTLVFQGLGHVHLSGAGKATRIRAYSQAESAIEFRQCDSVQVHDLHIRTGRAGTDEHLRGGISGLDCTDVSIYRVSVDAASASQRTASCLNFRMNTQGVNSSVMIKDCECQAGNRQIGILVTDYQQVDITNNRIGLAESRTVSTKPKVGFVLEQADTTLKQIEKELQDYREALPQELFSMFSGFYRWTGAGSSSGDTGRVVTGEDTITAAPATVSERAILQGIVVGGGRSEEVRILDNHVESAIQGIHIGLSHEESARGTPDLFAYVTIAGNRLKNQLPKNYNGERHAIFVGNCQSALIRNNHASLQRLNQAGQSIEAIRLFGHYGRRVLVQGNHTQGFNTGIRMQVRNVTTSPPKLWVIRENLLESSSHVVVINSAASPLVIRENNVS